LSRIKPKLEQTKLGQISHLNAPPLVKRTASDSECCACWNSLLMIQEHVQMSRSVYQQRFWDLHSWLKVFPTQQSASPLASLPQDGITANGWDMAQQMGLAWAQTHPTSLWDGFLLAGSDVYFREFDDFWDLIISLLDLEHFVSQALNYMVSFVKN